MPRAFTSLQGVLLVLVLAAPVSAQTIAPCGDCARKSNTIVSFAIARCCWYETNRPQDEQCNYLKSQGWSIEHRGYFTCQTYTMPDGVSQNCTGQECGGVNFDPCADGGCTPGYYRTDTCHSDQELDECGCCWDGSPIVLDLSGDGYRFSSAASGVMFDVNGLGHVLWVAWPMSSDDAWLTLDRNGNGTIDSGAELFGNVTRLASGRAASDGYQALAEFDGDHNQLIDTRDDIYARLLVWGDLNRDGISQPGELQPLSTVGVAAISVAARSSRRHDASGNEFRLRAKMFLTDGSQRFSYDVFLDVEPISGITSVALGRCPKAAVSAGTNP